MNSIKANSFSEKLLHYVILYFAKQNSHDNVVEYISQLNNSHDNEMEKFASIFLAAQNGQLDILKLFLEEITKKDDLKNETLPEEADNNAKTKNCMNINMTDLTGRTILSIVAEFNLSDIIKYLIYEGANVNTIDNFGCSPMHYAAYHGHVEVVKLLSEKVEDINLMNTSKSTALFWATENGHDDVVKILLSKGADVNIGSNNYLPIISATIRERETIAMMLLNKDINKEAIITSISIAIEIRKTAILSMLLNKVGVDVLIDNQQKTPLVLAVLYGYEDIVRFLLFKGANINHLDTNGYSLLHYASWQGHMEIVKLLLEKGLQVDSKTH